MNALSMVIRFSENRICVASGFWFRRNAECGSRCLRAKMLYCSQAEKLEHKAADNFSPQVQVSVYTARETPDIPRVHISTFNQVLNENPPILDISLLEGIHFMHVDSK